MDHIKPAIITRCCCPAAGLQTNYNTNSIQCYKKHQKKHLKAYLKQFSPLIWHSCSLMCI